MTKKILASLLAILGLGLTAAPTLAQQIPSGYALVPLSSLASGEVFASTTLNTTTAISAENSTLRASNELIFLGEEELVMTATLRDTTGNPLAGHTVSLTSSRSTDRVQTTQGTTNTNGEAIFFVAGELEGVSTFTAIDAASGTVLTDRSRVVFLGNANAIGGEDNLLSANLLAQAPLADEQIVASFPSTVAINEPTDITIDITDLTGELLEDYAGTLTFESTDALALLPRDYTFTPLDRGTHTFANAVTLIEPGGTTITISADTATSPADVIVNVEGTPTAKTDAPSITEPTQNSLWGRDTLTVSGTTTANSNIAIFIDGQVSGRGTSGLNGEFAVPLTGLFDGSQEIKVALLDFNNSILSISDPIAIMVDTEPPQVISTTATPESVLSGGDITITVQSEANLLVANLSVDGQTFGLTEGAAGVYSTRIAILAPGTHLPDITLTDAAGNITTESAATSFTVGTPITIQPVETAPQGKRVDFSWAPPANHAEVNHYVIRYGRSPDELDQEYTTTDNGTTWYIVGLNDYTNYYFQVFSYAADGLPNGQSEIVSETPRSVLNLNATACDTKVQLDWQRQPDERIRNYQVAYGLAAGDYIERRSLPDDRVSWEVRNLINDVPYYFTIRGLDAANQIVFQTNEETVATPSVGSCREAAGDEPIVEQPIQLWQQTDTDGSTILVWNPVSSATAYRVYAGTEPNNFDLPTAEVTTPYLKPTGLAAETEYYFAVRAIYGNGHEAANFSNVLKIEVGPAEAIALAAGLALAGSWLIRRRRQ